MDTSYLKSLEAALGQFTVKLEDAAYGIRLTWLRVGELKFAPSMNIYFKAEREHMAEIAMQVAASLAFPRHVESVAVLLHAS